MKLQIKNAGGVWEAVTKKPVQRDGEYLSTEDFMAGENDEESWKCPVEDEWVWWRFVED